jgi:hypothetical protein
VHAKFARMTAEPKMFGWLKPEAKRPVLDAAYLARLSGHLGQTVLDELLADGLIELTDRVNRAAELSRAGDTAALRRLGHDLVGMAGHLGLSRLSTAAVELGRQLRDGGDDGAQACDALCREGALAAEALRRYLGQ